MKLNLPLFLAAMFVFSLSLRAQSTYQNGYIVGLRGDTLRGRIDHQDWVDNPDRIDFADGGTGKSSTYTAAELAAFFVNDELYRSYKVRIYPYSQDPAVVTAPEWTGQPYDTVVFLRLVTEGRLNLYCFRDRTDVTYFFLQKGGIGQQPQLLRIQNHVVRRDAASNVTTENVYKYQLADYVAACKVVADKPVPVAYEENALKKLIDTYNHCGVETVGKGGRRVLVNILPMAGYLQSRVGFSGNSDAAHASWPAFSGPIGGLGFLIRPGRGSRKAQRWGLLVDGLYDQVLIYSHHYQKSYYQNWYGKLAYSEVRADVQIRYSYPLGDFRPFLGLGFSNSLIFNNTSSQKTIDAATNTTIRQELFGSNGYFSSYRPGGFGVVGFAWKRWSLEGRYERTADLVNSTTGAVAKVTNMYALAALRF